MDIIVIHGAPGCGKSTAARALHEALRCPWFEFGWIPEFRRLEGHMDISASAEEELSFENLVLVAKNYIKHGFKNVVLTDLNDRRMLDIPVVFSGLDYAIITLYCADEGEIARRLLSRQDGNTYKNVPQALEINRRIMRRPPLPGETRIRVCGMAPPQVLEAILSALEDHARPPAFRRDEHDPRDYFSYC